MTRRPRHPRPDENQKAIVDALNAHDDFEAYGAISKLTDKECPGDVAVLHIPSRQWQLFEVKKPHGAKVSVRQLERQEFVPIVYWLEDILNWFGYEGGEG